MRQGEAHGGYLCRLEDLDGAALPALARQALTTDGQDPEGVGVLVSVEKRVVRLAYDGPHTYGRRGARWYGRHHALAALLSRAYPSPVHVYVHDPDEGEQVVAYGAGRRVGGETLRYDEVEVDELSEAAFEAARASWPMGRLAGLLGLTRAELLRLPFARSVLIRLDEEVVPSLEPLWGEAPR